MPRSHHDSGGGSDGFRTEGGDNSIQEYGDESSAAEFTDAATALHTYFDARAAGAWKAACESLAAGTTEMLVEQLGGGRGTSCATVLSSLSVGLPGSALREAAVADVGALRADGDTAFLLFHGAHGENFFIPMRREDGHWKVGAIAATSLG